MTKRSLQHWSGYRGNGKPSIPCAQKQVVQKSDVTGRFVRMPSDYKAKTERTDSGPRKEIRRLYKLLTKAKQPAVQDLYQYMTYSLIGSQDRIYVARRARKACDLDMLRVLVSFTDKYAAEHIEPTVHALRETGFKEAHGVITDKHIDTYITIRGLVGGYNLYDARKTSGLLENIHEITTVAFKSEANRVMVMELVTHRCITDVGTIREMVSAMKNDAAALSLGVL